MLCSGPARRCHAPNVAVVTPRSDAAGFVSASTNEDLSRPTGSTIEGRQPRGTGSLAVTIVDRDQINQDDVFRLTFFDSTNATGVYETVGYELRNVTSNTILLPRQPLRESTPSVAGFTVDIMNDEPALDLGRSGWVGTDEDGNELVSPDPSDLNNFGSNWNATIRQDNSANFAVSTDDYELLYTTDSLYSATRFTGGFISAEIPFWCRNVTKQEACNILVLDSNENGVYDLTDVLVINERSGAFGPRMFRYQVSFGAFADPANDPDGGSIRAPSPRAPSPRRGCASAAPRGRPAHPR